MRIVALLVFLTAALMPVSAATPPPLHFAARFLNSPSSHARLIIADGTGNLFVISNVCQSQPEANLGWQLMRTSGPCLSDGQSTVQVTRTDLSGNPLGTFSFGGSGYTIPQAAAIDRAGNLLIGGSTSSPDFPLLSPLQTTGGAFLTKIDPMLKGIVYSTRFGSAPALSVTISALTVDAGGNTYFAGTTGGGLPVTPGAFQAEGSSATNAASAYVAEISPSGNALVFATYYHGSLPANIQGIPLNPIAYPPITNPAAILVDSDGSILVSGWTSDNLPVTPGAYSTAAPKDPLSEGVGFVAKFRPGGTGLAWATYLPHVAVSSLAQDGAGNLVLGGLAHAGLTTTPDALQPEFPQAPPLPPAGEGAIAVSAGCLLKLAPAGDSLVYGTYFGGNTIVGPNALSPMVRGLAFDQSGNVWITGTSSPVALPPHSAPVLGQAWVAELSSDLKTILALNSVPEGSAGVAISAAGGTIAAIGSGNLLLLASPGTGPSVLGIASSLGFETSSVISPGELVSLYGLGIGPAAAQPAQLGEDGSIARVLGATQVLFNGKAAALLYAGPNQINAIVPETLRGNKQASVQVIAPSGTVDVSGLTVQDYLPTMFSTIAGFAAPALNENGSVNSAFNPARQGSIVAVWLTGIGSATGSDNTINISAPRSSTAPVSVMPLGLSGPGAPLPVYYVGDAPEKPAGVSQINFRLPEGREFSGGSPSFIVQAGSEVSQTFAIYVE